jgi:hypothetical protein
MPGFPLRDNQRVLTLAAAEVEKGGNAGGRSMIFDYSSERPGPSEKHRILALVACVSLVACILWIWVSHAVRTPEYILQGRVAMKVCPEHLATIGVGLKRYAADHGGNLPRNLEALHNDGYVSKEWDFVCPESNDIPGGYSYELIAGDQKLSQLAPSDIVVREREFNHDIEPFSSKKQCRFLLRANGSVVKEFRAYVAPRPATSSAEP